MEVAEISGVLQHLLSMCWGEVFDQIHSQGLHRCLASLEPRAGPQRSPRRDTQPPFPRSGTGE
eukprot:2095779-Lingulodinium_polyedra.AAC.1